MNVIFKSLLMMALAASPLLAQSREPSDAQKLKWILGSEKGAPQIRLDRRFKPEGEINAVGTIVAVEGKLYFKTADHPFLKEKVFPYPELFFEIQPSQQHAYAPLLTQEILQGKSIKYSGPLRIKGNWAYERASVNFSSGHYFGLVWVDAATRVQTSPAGDWTEFQKRLKASAAVETPKRE